MYCAGFPKFLKISALGLQFFLQTSTCSLYIRSKHLKRTHWMWVALTCLGVWVCESGQWPSLYYPWDQPPPPPPHPTINPHPTYTPHFDPALSNHPPPGNKTTNMERVISSGPTVTVHQTTTCSRERWLHIHTKRQLHETDCQSSGMPGMLVNRFFMFLFPFEYRSQLFIDHSKVPLHCVVYNYFHFHTRKCIHFLSHCLGELVPCTQVHISEIGAMLAIIWHRENHLPGKPLE